MQTKFQRIFLCAVPTTPPSVEVVSSNKSHIEFKWTPPENTVNPFFFISLSSSYWGQHWNKSWINTTEYRFENLKSGTKYQFEVQTMTDTRKSSPKRVSKFTGESYLVLLISQCILKMDVMASFVLPS